MSSLGVDRSNFLRETSGFSPMELGSDHPTSLRNRFGKLLTLFEPVADGLTVAGAIFLGFLIYHSLQLGKQLDYSARSMSYIALAVSVLFVILLDRDGAYRHGSSLLKIKETERAFRVSAQAFLLVLPVTFFTQHLFSRWVFVIALICAPVLLVSEKQLFLVCVRALRARGIGVQHVLVYGAGSSGRRVFSALARSATRLGLKPVAMIDDNPDLAGREVFSDSYRREDSVQILCEPVTESLLERFQCEFLVIAIPSLGGEEFARLVQMARNVNVRIAFLPAQATAMNYWTEEADIDGLMLSMVGRAAKGWHYEATKRPFDTIAAAILIITLSPLLLLIALLVRWGSPGPMLFRQKRVGRNGKLFDLYKFRSMYVDAPKYSFSPKRTEDPRITRIGRFLRRTSLDELPQLFNVLKGEMSLVGPRPEMPFIVEKYDAVHRQRLQVTPGITGLWQISADRAFLIHENIQYDLYYIRHRSFFMDFAILLHTAVFAMRGI
jgi:exopolysaccharide biosynthesis polyprenyl glycosylphosphotransferase